MGTNIDAIARVLTTTLAPVYKSLQDINNYPFEEFPLSHTASSEHKQLYNYIPYITVQASSIAERCHLTKGSRYTAR